jgi:hypothetical protein
MYSHARLRRMRRTYLDCAHYCSTSGSNPRRRAYRICGIDSATISTITRNRCAHSAHRFNNKRRDTIETSSSGSHNHCKASSSSSSYIVRDSHSLRRHYSRFHTLLTHSTWLEVGCSWLIRCTCARSDRNRVQAQGGFGLRARRGGMSKRGGRRKECCGSGACQNRSFGEYNFNSVVYVA